MEKRSSKILNIALPIAAAAMIVALIILAVISEKDEPRSREYYGWFDTFSQIYDYSGGSEEEFEESCALISDRFDYYNRLFDIYNEYEGVTNLATVNRLAPDGAVKVDGELLEFLEYSVEIHELTDGYVNIAMGAVLSLWHDEREAASGGEGRLPDMTELSEAAKHCDITKLVIDKEGSTVEFLDPEMTLDVGAIAKGYATERVAELLAERGISGYALDIGGNLRVVGAKPSGEGWTTGIRNPDTSADNAYIKTFDIIDQSAVTSGDYERYYIVDGKKYHHIINKDTLMPAESFASVTIITRDSGLADGLSTALFCMDYEKGRALIESLDGVSAVWVYHNGETAEVKN